MSKRTGPYPYKQRKVRGRKIDEHRLVMEEALKRPLLTEEHVHHRDQNKKNNDPENLEVINASDHGLIHSPQRYPTDKTCVICEATFTPHKTKRRRQQTCGPICKSALLRQRWAERRSTTWAVPNG